jgi:hypothetical protein
MFLEQPGLVLYCRRFHLQTLTVIIIAASIMMLTGCSIAVQQVTKSSGRSITDSSATATHHRLTLREKLEAGTGTFNRDDPNFHLFDPCKEISPETYHQLGWKQDELSYSYLEVSQIVNCGFSGTEENRGSGTMALANDALPYSHIQELGLVITDLDVELPTGFYIHEIISPDEEYCVAAVQTNAGRLNVTHASAPFAVAPPKTTICQKAVDFLSQILDTEV